MKENFIKLTDNLIFGLIGLAAAVIPLFFLPITSEFFEFNKFTALLVITIFGYLLWVVRMILRKQTTFVRTPLDLPILILVVVYFVASLASIDQFISLVGGQGRPWPSFFALATLAAFYFLAVSNLRHKNQIKTILWVLIGSTTLASLAAIASYFALYLPFEFAKIRSFNTVGIINNLAILQTLIIPLAANFAIFSRNKSVKTSAIILTLVMVFSLILINFWPAYLVLALAILFAGFTAMRTKLDKTQHGSIALLGVATIFFLVLRFVPQVAHGTLYAWIAEKDATLTEAKQIDTPKDIVLSKQTAWDISARAIGKRPLFGTGPATFQFAYTQLKPRYVNNTDAWAVRFDKASSDLSQLITEDGIFGILAYLLLVVVILRFIWTLILNSQHFVEYVPLTSSAVAYIVASFLVISSFTTAASFFLILALISALAKANDEKHTFEVAVEIATLKGKFGWFPLGSNLGVIKTTTEGKETKSQFLPGILAIIIVAISVLALKYQLGAYRAEYFYRQSLLASQANDGNKTVDFLQKAIRANPKIDTYHRTLSQTALNAAINLNRRGNLNDDQKQLLTQLTQVAIDQGKVASGYQILPLKLPGISAANVVNWETISGAYQAIIGAVGGADIHAINTLAQAVSLDPENPLLHDQLGQLYQRLNNLDLAQRKFEDAIVVKGDYGPAHYRLAKLLIEKKGEVARIVNELVLAKRFLKADDPAIPEIEKDLETYNKQLRELQEKATQEQQAPQSPTPQASPTPSPSPTPTPLVSPRGSSILSPQPSPGL